MSRIIVGPGLGKDGVQPSKLKTTIGGAIKEQPIFYDSKGRSVLVGDEITLNSSTGTVNRANVEAVFFDDARKQIGLTIWLAIGGRTHISQNDIYNIPNRIVSDTAEGARREINAEVVARVPRSLTGPLKTTLPGGPEGGTTP